MFKFTLTFLHLNSLRIQTEYYILPLTESAKLR